MSTQTAQGEVQAAIYSVLAPADVVDAILSSLGVRGVFDEVPEDQQFDYISFGPTVESPNNALGRRGYTVFFQIDIWSRQPGFKTAQAILARMNKLLDQPDTPLPLATQTPVYCMYDQSQQLRDPDEFGTRHIAARYKIFSQE